jgi:hypothetical protein
VERLPDRDADAEEDGGDEERRQRADDALAASAHGS